MTRDERDELRGDVWYEVWRSGGNPDLVDDDRLDDCLDSGAYPEECAMSEVRRQRRRHNNEIE